MKLTANVYFFGFLGLLICSSASNLREREEVPSSTSKNYLETLLPGSPLLIRRSSNQRETFASGNSVSTVETTKIPSASPTSIPSIFKHVTKILPKFAPSCAPSNPPSIKSYQNPQIRFYTPINYFQSNPTAISFSQQTFLQQEVLHACKIYLLFSFKLNTLYLTNIIIYI